MSGVDRVRRGRFGPLQALRTLAFYLIFYLGTVLMLLLAVVPLALVSRWLRPLCDGWSRYHRRCVRYILGIRVVVEGEVPKAGVLVAAKHESFFEAIDMPTLIANPSVFAKAELMRLPIWGKIAARYGLIEVEREAGAKALRAMISAGRRLTADGRVLVIFPEGTRVPHGSQPQMQAGFAGIYKLLGMPVVPLAVDSGDLYHCFWKRRGTITYRFGEVIPAGLPRDEIEARVHTAINALNSGEPV